MTILFFKSWGVIASQIALNLAVQLSLVSKVLMYILNKIDFRKYPFDEQNKAAENNKCPWEHPLNTSKPKLEILENQPHPHPGFAILHTLLVTLLHALPLSVMYFMDDPYYENHKKKT